MRLYTVYYISVNCSLYMFRVLTPPIIGNTYNCNRVVNPPIIRSTYNCNRVVNPPIIRSTYNCKRVVNPPIIRSTYNCNRVINPPIIRSTHNCNHSIWHWSNRLCYLPLSWSSCSSCSTVDLYEAQHVSGDTPPIIRSLKLH